MFTNTYYVSATNSNQIWGSSDWSWFGYEPPSRESGRGGQGSFGWRNFQRCLRAVREFIRPFITFKLKLPTRHRFDHRSEPRWKSERWKAKT